MRPLGDTPAQGHRANDGGPPPAAAQPPRMTYTGPIDESTLNDALQQPLFEFTQAIRDPPKQSTAHEAGAGGPAGLAPSSMSKHGAAPQREPSAVSRASSVLDLGDDSDDASWTSGSPKLRLKTGSPSLTPILLPSGSVSALSGASSPRGSLRFSLFGETDSQGPSAGEEMEPQPSTSPEETNSNVQLVMPSIKMPSRRPFTEKGKRMGRLKVLLAGNSGVGKTALIKAIAQTADAIVHVDPIVPPLAVSRRRSSNRGPARFTSLRKSHATKQISQIFASTRPLPEWWSELGDITRRGRGSMGDDAILDRNICFIDTPGYGGASSNMDTITPTVRYVESFFEMVSTNGTTDPEMVKMLGGDGGSQVDVVLYLIKTKLRPDDLKYLELLATLTNVIPVIAHADTMSSEDIAQCKKRVRSELTQVDIRPFLFKDDPDWPYAVSSLPGSDHDIMEASVLMSPDYQQPLVASELARLTEQMFCENGASWLRHAAAQKYIQWKASASSPRPRTLPRSLTAPASPHAMNSLVSLGLRAPQTGLIDAELQEERLARIRLSNWASRLQSSLRREQAQYESLLRGQRNSWLLEKLSEDIRDGRIVAVRDTARRDIERGVLELGEKRTSTLPSTRRTTSTELHQDPLGLVQVSANMRARSWEAVQMLGGVGILSGLIFMAAKQGWCAQVIGWTADTWAEFWYNEIPW